MECQMAHNPIISELPNNIIVYPKSQLWGSIIQIMLFYNYIYGGP